MRISSLSVFVCFLFFIFHEAQAGSKELIILSALMLLSPSAQQETELDSQQELVESGNAGTIRRLASVRRIVKVEPIKGADCIEVATVDGWKVVVQKGLYGVGDKIIYFEVDSFLPIKEKFEFLRKSSYKKVSEGKEGFRLRTIKLRGQVSQGLIMPISLLGEDNFNVGDDVTQLLEVTKYEPAEAFKCYASDIKGYFPGFIEKSDEERIQNLSSDFESYKEKNFFVSEKLDGTSSTFYMRDNAFGVCSKNYELKRIDNNTFWKVATDNDIESKLRKLQRNIAIQGEIIGEKIQSNKYNIKGHKMYVFNVFDINKHEYCPKAEMLEICRNLDLDACHVISDNKKVPDTIDEILADADGKSELNDKKKREGLVWVFDGNQPNERISFKTISNEYLLKKKG